MGTASRFQIQSAHDAPTEEELDALRKEADTPTPPQTQARIGTKQSVEYGADGSQTIRGHGVQRVEMNFSHADRVTIDGMTTTRAAAIAAGVLPAEGGPIVAGHPTQPPQTNYQTASEGDKSNDDSGGDDRDDDKPDAATTERTEAASAVLTEVSAAIGPTAVEANLNHAAETGEMPMNLPEGVSDEQAQTVVEGYVAAAESTLSGVGASVAAVEEMLDEEGIKQARHATVTNNTGLLKDLGRKAVTRLEMMPSREPEKFAEVIETLPPEQRKMVVKQNGQWILKAPGAEMRWETAVRNGIIKF